MPESYLISWRPSGEIPGSGWPESKLRELVRRFNARGTAVEPWTFHSYRMAKVGDKVYANRQGWRGHALFGSGTISRIPDPYRGLVDIRFQHLVDPGTAPIADAQELHAINGKVWETRRSGMPLTRSVASALGRLVARKRLDTSRNWSSGEIKALVTDYFAMLRKEARGERYIKARHRAQLKSRLRKRSNGSIEFKHQNISAILKEAGISYIRGYRPRYNYQAALAATVLSFAKTERRRIEKAARRFDAPPAKSRLPRDLETLFVNPPGGGSPGRLRRGHTSGSVGPGFNYTERDAANKALGRAGEKFVLNAERKRLTACGRPDLARKIEWVADSIGDGPGYDIRSFDRSTGRERYIEVKTTNHGATAAFYLTARELECGKRNASKYRIYRLYAFKTAPRIFVLKGNPAKRLALAATQYRAIVRRANARSRS